MRTFATRPMLFNSIKIAVGKRLSSTTTRSIFLTPKLTLRAAGFTMATTVGIAAPWVHQSCNVIYNDALVDASRNPDTALPTMATMSEGATKDPVKTRSRFGGKLDYRQLCVGSIFGLVLGIIAGKISPLLVYVSAIGFLTVQWMQNRGIIDKSTTRSIFARYMIKTGRESVDLNTLIWERPSFKVSFLLTFLLAAVNI